MLIERIILCNVIDSDSQSYSTWIQFKSQSRPTIVFCSKHGKKDNFYIESVFMSAGLEDEHFIICDGFDGKQDIKIPLTEIKKLCKQILFAVPGTIGRLELQVSFIPADPSLPF